MNSSSLFPSHPHISPLLDEILATLQRVLEDKLRGFYLTGSLVSGGFVEGVSDMDLFALLAEELSEAEFAALEKAHLAFVAGHAEWENRLEIVYLSEEGLATFREKRSPIAVISPGEPFNIKDAGADWAINWYVLRQQGRALYGTPVEQAFPEISQAEFVADVRAQALDWGSYVENTRERVRYQAYAVVTLSRSLFAVRHAEQPSKQQAGDWVKSEYAQFGELIDWAFAIRVMDDENLPEPEESYAGVRNFVEFVLGEITV